MNPQYNFSYSYTSNQTNLDLLLSASRTKYLLLPHANNFIRKLLSPLYLGRPRVTFSLPKVSVLPKNFIRLDPWEIETLYSIAKSIKGNIVEIGRFNGGSTSVLCSANTTSNIYSIDISPKNDPLLISLFSELMIGRNVSLIVGDANIIANSFNHPIDLLFIDGDHSYDGCISDLKSWWPKLSIGGHLVLHDCYLGSEVQSAVTDFLIDKSFDSLSSPFIPRFHYRISSGSLCHLIKR